MITLASYIRILAYNLKEFVTFNPDGSMELIIDKVPMEVCGKFSKALNHLGYDIRGAQDALELTRKRSKDEGVSVTFRKDDEHIKAFKAAVGKVDLQKPKSKKSVIDKAIEMFGITENPASAGYILSDGRMLNFGEGGSRSKDHREIGILLDGDLRGFEAIKAFCELGNIRMNVGTSSISFDIFVRITPDQLDRIENLIEHYDNMTAHISVPGGRSAEFKGIEGVRDFIEKHGLL